MNGLQTIGRMLPQGLMLGLSAAVMLSPMLGSKPAKPPAASWPAAPIARPAAVALPAYSRPLNQSIPARSQTPSWVF